MMSMAAVRRSFTSRELPEITIPVLIGVGERSPTGLHDVARQLAKAIPNAKYSQLAGQDHMVNAKKLLPLLSGFFR